MSSKRPPGGSVTVISWPWWLS